MRRLSADDGKKLLKAARDSVVAYFEKKQFTLNGFPEKLGVFVTIKTYPSHELRGCIGFPEPVYPLNVGLPKAALLAAFQDSRFSPLERDELKKIVFEVSVLTKPKLIKVRKADDYLKKIKVGVDGLIVEQGFNRGLLLPVVPVEYGWNCEQFLEHTCMKAFLPRDSWKDVNNCRVYCFQAQVFSEKKPGVV
ncbi:MAG: TIGR00296 family protein [Candidatus Nanoarchaeia archaeon]